MIQAICRVLLHSLWQGLLFTIITGFVMLYTKRRRAAVRYRILSGLFFLFLAVCLSTLLWELYAGPGRWDAGWVDESGKTDSHSFVFIIHQISGYCRMHASLIVLGWFVVFLAKCVRMTSGLVYTQRIRYYGAVEAPDRWKEKIHAFCRHLGVERTVLLLESGIVRVPMVIGHLKPVIFIPMGLLTGLPEKEIEVVLLHELAHIRRHDYFVNFLQHVAENIFFFNPGLLWISSLLREERENCCDDIAIAHTNDKVAFVRALVSCKEHLLMRKGVAVAFPSGRHQLLKRVLRITDNRNKGLNAGEKLFFLGSCLLASALLLSVHGPILPVREYQYTLSEEKTMVVEAARHRVVLSSKPLPGLERTSVAGRAAEETGDREGVTRDRGGEPAGEKNGVQAGERAVERAGEWVGQEGGQERGRRGQTGLAVKESETEEASAVMADEQEEKAEAGLKEVAERRDKIQAQRDKVQAERDRAEAQLDQAQAERDQIQAMMDKEQAVRDEQQAQQDQRQGLRDQGQAERDLGQAKKDRQQAEMQQAERQRVRPKAAGVVKIRIE